MGVLRLLLAISVLDTHLGLSSALPNQLGLGFVYGGQAVQIFFIISGFYMALVLHEKYNRPGDYFPFLQQRFLRLFPTHLLVATFFAVAFCGWYVITGRGIGTVEYYVRYWNLQTPFTLLVYSFCNFALLGSDVICFFRQDLTTGQFYLLLPPPGTTSVWTVAFALNPPTWTLATEILFYLLAPFIVRRSIALQLALLLASVALRWGLVWAKADQLFVCLTYFPPSNLAFFLAGSIGYRFWQIRRGWLEAFARKYSWSALIFGAVLLFYRRIPQAHDLDVFLILIAAAMVPFLFALTRENRLDRFVGELSYAFYLIHWNVLISVQAMFGAASRLCGPVSFLVTMVAAISVYWFFERRVDSWRERLFRRTEEHP